MISQISGRVSQFLLVCLFALTVERNQVVDHAGDRTGDHTGDCAGDRTVAVVLMRPVPSRGVQACGGLCIISTFPCVSDCPALEVPEDHCVCKVCHRKLPHYIHFKFSYF